jgi:hypothetical protein
LGGKIEFKTAPQPTKQMFTVGFWVVVGEMMMMGDPNEKWNDGSSGLESTGLLLSNARAL